MDNFSFNCMAMSPEQQRDFLFHVLGPKLNSSGYGKEKLKVMIADDQRPLLAKWADTVLNQTDLAKEYVAGLAFHWYINKLTPPDVLDQIAAKYPEYFLLSTEACEGSSPFDEKKVELGSWLRAENYAADIITDLKHHTGGWIDWNLALDLQGGPNWVSNFVDAPILVNASSGEYLKQPMYYALGHFSRFLEPGSVRLGVNQNDEKALDVVVFETPSNSTVAIVLNRFQSDIPLQLVDAKYGSLRTSIGAHSLQTFVWFN